MIAKEAHLGGHQPRWLVGDGLRDGAVQGTHVRDLHALGAAALARVPGDSVEDDVVEAALPIDVIDDRPGHLVAALGALHRSLQVVTTTSKLPSSSVSNVKITTTPCWVAR